MIEHSPQSSWIELEALAWAVASGHMLRFHSHLKELPSLSLELRLIFRNPKGQKKEIPGCIRR